MPLSATLIVQAAINLTSALDLVTGAAPLNFKQSNAFADGNGLGQAEDVFSDERTLAASTSEELDLSGGLTNIYGASLTFTKIKAIVVKADPTNGDNIEVGGSASNGFDSWVGATGDFVVVVPGGTLALAGIHMSAIPEMPYELLSRERTVRSVANSTREDARELLELAAEIPVRTDVTTVPLEEANAALLAVKESRVSGDAVLVI